MRDQLFRTLDEVLSLHAEQIRLFGGSPGIRDIRPSSLCRGASRRLYDLIIGVAEGRISKASVTVFLEKHETRR